MQLKWRNIVALGLAVGAAVLLARHTHELGRFIDGLDGTWTSDPAQRRFLLASIAIVLLALAAKLIGSDREGRV